MFTGLIMDMGKVLSIESNKTSKYRRVIISSKLLSKKVRKGDSVAINGVCLTVVQFSRFFSTLEFEILCSSLEKTNLSMLQKDHAVNLELPLRVGDPLGGHFVLGHVESTGTITAITNSSTKNDESSVSRHVSESNVTRNLENDDEEINRFFTIQVPSTMMSYMCPEGSVTLDGISLTITHVDIHTSTISVNIVPHTYYCTNLQYRKQGDTLNIEPDILLKHITYLSSSYGTILRS